MSIEQSLPSAKAAYLPLLVTIAGGVLYHFAQKSVPKHANPYALIITAYLAGIICCGGALLLEGAPWRSTLSWQHLHWSGMLIGVSAAMIELGFLFVYRTGWQLSATSVIVNISVAVILVPLGITLFRERLSLQNIVGIVCCLFGLFLLARK